MYAESHSSFGLKKDSVRTPSKSATSYAPPVSEGQEKNTPNTLTRNIAVSISPSSSSGSVSTLNPHAKVNLLLSYVLVLKQVTDI